MTTELGPGGTRTRRSRLALAAVALTALACLAALALRTPLRSRVWAYRIRQDPSPAKRAVYLGALCNTGEKARWGIEALLGDGTADVRQYGVLVLQHVKTEWARQRLLDLLHDSDATVRRLAAAGLAIQHDERVIPALKEMYATGDETSAAAACLALERLGTPAAVAALAELARKPVDVARTAALIDALEGIGTFDCLPVLDGFSRDDRPCDLPPRDEQLVSRALEGLATAGYARAPASLPTTSPRPRTIAERASAARVRISGDFDPSQFARPGDE